MRITWRHDLHSEKPFAAMISTDEGITIRPSDGDLLNTNYRIVEEHRISQTHTPSSFRMSNSHRLVTGDVISSTYKNLDF
jgi:hypothetical protein